MSGEVWALRLSHEGEDFGWFTTAHAEAMAIAIKAGLRTVKLMPGKLTDAMTWALRLDAQRVTRDLRLVMKGWTVEPADVAREVETREAASAVLAMAPARSVGDG